MNFDLVDISSVAINKLVQLSVPALGEGYLTKKYFIKINKSDNYKGIAVVYKGELVAFLVYYFTTRNEVVKNINDLSIASCLDNDIICIDTIVVRAEYRKKGIGKELIKNIVNKYEKKFSFLMYAWNQDGVVNMKKIAEDFFFKPIGEYARIWEKDCKKGVFKCPAKKGKGCMCSAVLLYRRL